jgi:hypothetical protein
MLPPLARGGIVESSESVAGATPITPAKGASGIVMLSLKRATVSPGAILKVFRYGSPNWSARKPKPGTTAAHPQSPTSMSSSVTRSTSPGSAPST